MQAADAPRAPRRLRKPHLDRQKWNTPEHSHRRTAEEAQELAPVDIGKEVKRIQADVRSGKDFTQVKSDMVGVIKSAFPDDGKLVAKLQSAAEAFEDATFGSWPETLGRGASSIFDESPSPASAEAESSLDSLVCDTRSRESSFISAGGASFCLDRSVSEGEDRHEDGAVAAADEELRGEPTSDTPQVHLADFLFPSPHADEEAARRALLASRRQIYMRTKSRSAFLSPDARLAAKDPRQLLMRFFGKIVRRKLQQAAASRASQSVNSSYLKSTDEMSAVLTSTDSGLSCSPRMWTFELEEWLPKAWQPRRQPHARNVALAKAKAQRPLRGSPDTSRGQNKVSFQVTAERSCKQRSSSRPDDPKDPKECSRWDRIKDAAEIQSKSSLHARKSASRNLEAIMVERSNRKHVIRSVRLHKAPQVDLRCEAAKKVEAWTPEPLQLSSGQRDWATGMARLAQTPNDFHPQSMAQIWEEVARRPASVAEVRARSELPRPVSQQAVYCERAKPFSLPPTAALETGLVWDIVN